MRKLIFVLVCFVFSESICAQPGYPPDKYLNLNEIPDSAKYVATDNFGSDPYSNYSIYYYIDHSTTNFKKLNLLTEIRLELNYIPKEIIEYGQKLERLIIISENYSMSNNTRNAVIHDTIKNLTVLNSLPHLKYISVSGFFIDEEDTFQSLIKETSVAQKNNQLRHFSFGDVEILNFPSNLIMNGLSLNSISNIAFSSISRNVFIKEIVLNNLKISKLPNELPASLECLEIRNCDSLIDVSNLSAYPFVRSIKIIDGFHINNFPKSLRSKEFNEVVLNIRPEMVGKVMDAMRNVTKIKSLTFEIYDIIGLADFDFKKRKLNLDDLKISSLGQKPIIHLTGIDSLAVTNIYLGGVFDAVPNISKLIGLRKLRISSYIPMDEKSAEELFKLKDLKNFVMSNFKAKQIPKYFFENNTMLERLEISASEISNLSFSNIVLSNLKNFILTYNLKLEKIPKKKYYPNGYLHLNGNKKEKYMN